MSNQHYYGRSHGDQASGHPPARTGPKPGPSSAGSGTGRPSATGGWQAQLTWQAITPLHPGTGQVSASDIDLPVAREGGTGLPMVPASSIKGVFRNGVGVDNHTTPEEVQARKLYGFADRAAPGTTGSAVASSGTLTFTDARLFALAVPSFWGTFALLTCPIVLRRLDRDRKLLGLPSLGSIPVPARAQGSALAGFTATHTEVSFQNRSVVGDLDVVTKSQVFLDHLSVPDQTARARLLLVHDDVFAAVCRTGLEVTPHVRLEDTTKTVKPGALWFEETIPAESLLTSFVIAETADGKGLLPASRLIRLGGKSSVGRGLMRVTREFGGAHV